MIEFSGRTLARRLRSLSQPRFVSFVAALWNASGWQTDIDGNIVVAERADRTIRLRVYHSSWFRLQRGVPTVEEPYDKLVISGYKPSWVQFTRQSPSQEIIDARDLHRRFRYGTDPEQAAAIEKEFLCSPFDRLEFPTGAFAPPRPSRRTSFILLVTVFAASVVVMTVGTGGIYGGQQAAPVGNADRWTAATYSGPSTVPVFDPDGRFRHREIDRLPEHIGVMGTGQLGPFAFKPDTGVGSWNYEAASNWRTAPLAANGTVIVSDNDGVVHALRLEDGTRLWRNQVSNRPIFSNPSIVKETLVVGTVDRGMIAMNLSDGTVEWRATEGIGQISQTIQVTSSSVVALDNNGTLTARTIDTGSERWRVNTMEFGRTIDMNVDPSTETAVLLTDGPELIGLKLSTGDVSWRRELAVEPTSITSVTNGTAYFATQNATVRAIGTIAGDLQWVSPSLNASQVSTPVPNNGTIFVTTQTGRISQLDQRTGSINQDMSINASGMSLPVPYEDKAIVISGSEERIYGLNFTTKEPDWALSIPSGVSLVSHPTVIAVAGPGGSVDGLVAGGARGRVIEPAGSPDRINEKGLRVTGPNWPLSGMVGEPYRIQFSVTHLGDDTETITMKGTFGERIFLNEELRVVPGSVQLIEIFHDPPAARTGMPYEIEFAGETFSRNVTIQAAPYFEITEVTVQPGDTAERIRIEANVTNTGQRFGEATISLRDTSGPLRSTERRIVAGGNRTASFEIDRSLIEASAKGRATLILLTQHDRQSTTVELRPDSLGSRIDRRAVILGGIALIGWLIVTRMSRRTEDE